jgi:hypothetical protein
MPLPYIWGYNPPCGWMGVSPYPLNGKIPPKTPDNPLMKAYTQKKFILIFSEKPKKNFWIKNYKI